jgi:uncharacterized phage protein (TIGR01671 family)
MRTIKFRAKIKAESFEQKIAMLMGTNCRPQNEGVWVYGDIRFQCIIPYIHNEIGKCPIDVDTVGQFTGLKDKNGKEIYEGDIVDVAVSPINYVGKDPTPYHRICVCVYQKENASFIYERVGKNYKRKLSRNWKYKVMGSYDIQCVEIIGNIYDNPELLTEK